MPKPPFVPLAEKIEVLFQKLEENQSRLEAANAERAKLHAKIVELTRMARMAGVDISQV